MLLSNATNDLLWKIHLVLLLQNKRVVIIWAVVGKLQLIESVKICFWTMMLLLGLVRTVESSYKWRLTVRQIFRSLSRICFPPSDKLSLELATQIKLSWASHAYLLCLMIWQWLAAVKPTKIMAWPFEESHLKEIESPEFLKSLSPSRKKNSLKRVFWWHKESRRSCQRKWFYQVQQENALVPYYCVLSKLFLGRPPVSNCKLLFW